MLKLIQLLILILWPLGVKAAESCDSLGERIVKLNMLGEMERFAYPPPFKFKDGYRIFSVYASKPCEPGKLVTLKLQCVNGTHTKTYTLVSDVLVLSCMDCGGKSVTLSGKYEYGSLFQLLHASGNLIAECQSAT